MTTKKTTKLAAAAIACAGLLFSSSITKAQTTTPANNWRFGIGVEGFAPTGNLKNISNVGIGGTARLQYGVNQNVALMLTSGYYNAFGKKINSDVSDAKYPSFGMVPVKAGIKGFIGSGFYLSGEVGAGFETKNAYENADGSKDTKLILAPGVGYSFKTIDIGARYENFSGQNNSYGLVGLRVAYGFGI
ncbi:hypothetical protein [Mucilaginibacter polytrichastri]|uniref:Outer membrane protein beta-barrel domain-containing protein n=1 Tax=Mucilaginibacter polytrichastri TaxID=1302689 RepID=A0A1Q5ZYE5_9SPHI|nr:hypothetical protein [Mucilaginibacter polytrichastri]OKS86776.1 hypothetical protein RG47T_2233 [Mucilaginibacter polytrichastri]SFT22582.1 hypothetical protein SAMN04487890_11927 [Mucilaginibacter polytrichastri]